MVDEFDDIARINNRATQVLKVMEASVREGNLMPSPGGGMTLSPPPPQMPQMPGPDGKMMPLTIPPAMPCHVFLGDQFLVATYQPEERAEAEALADALNEGLQPVAAKYKRKYLADLKKIVGK
jgi:hypothetical protein